VFRVLVPTIAALVTGTTETILSSVASSEPPQTVTPTLEASATAIEVDVAPLPIVILLESQATPVTKQTQTASPSLLAIEGQTAQSSGSEDDAAQFQVSHRTSAPDLTALVPPSDLSVLVLDAKGGEEPSMLGTEYVRFRWSM